MTFKNMKTLKIDMRVWLQTATIYMLIGIDAVGVFNDLAYKAGSTILMSLFTLLYDVGVVFVPLVVFYYLIIVNKIRNETILIVLTMTFLSILFFNIKESKIFYETWEYVIIRRFAKRGLILYLLIRMISEYDKIVKICSFFGKIIIIMVTMVLYSTEWITDYMCVSEILCISICIVFGCAVYYGNAIDYIISFVGIIAMAFWGNRGLFVCVGLALTFYILKKVPDNEKSKKFRYYSLILIALFFIFYILFGDEFTSWILVKLSSYEQISRNIKYILTNRLMDTSGRNEIWENLWKAIKQKPWGYGLLGDFVLNYKNLNWWSLGQERLIQGTYAHNGIIESMCEFGIIIGGLVWVWIFYNGYKTYRNLKNSYEIIMFITLFCCGICSLMTSYSYWLRAPFWGAIAFLINQAEIRRNDVRKNGIEESKQTTLNE
jgi:hypothetical protein